MICPLCEQSDGVMDNYCHRCSQDLDGYVLPEPAELEIIPGSDVKYRKQTMNPPFKLVIGLGVLDARRVEITDASNIRREEANTDFHC